MKTGHDFLAAGHYEDAALRSMQPGQVVGLFLSTFPKSPVSFCTKLGNQGKCSELLTHGAPFDRTHEYPIAKLLPSLRKQAAWAEALHNQFPNMEILFSPFCENHHSVAELIPVFNEMRQIAPSCLMVNSTTNNQVVPGTITDIHLSDSHHLTPIPNGEYVVSFDGFGGKGQGDMPDCDVDAIMAHYSNARHIRAWNFRYNGKYAWDDPVNDLGKRSHWPDVNYIKAHTAVMVPREGPLTWHANILLKAVAEDSNTPSGKACRFMVILGDAKPAPNTVDVIDTSGKVVSTLYRVKPDHPDGPRYYSKVYAYQIGDGARAKTGSSLVRVRYGNHVTPFTDANKRSGKFK